MDELRNAEMDKIKLLEAIFGGPIDAADVKIGMANIDKVLETLPEIEEFILKERFSNKTRAQLANDLKLTPDKIRQMESRALRKMRHPTRSRRLRCQRPPSLVDLLRIRFNRVSSLRHYPPIMIALQTPIGYESNHDFSRRTCNCFKNHNIKTVGDLVLKTKEELLGFRNLGIRTLREIEEFLKEINFSLKKSPNKRSLWMN
jgi:hypothetical protein